MAHFSGVSFYHPTRLLLIYKPRPLLLPFNPCKSGFRAFCVDRLFISDFLPCFSRPYTYSNLLSPLRTLYILLVIVLCYFSWVFFTYMATKCSSFTPRWVFLRPTSIRSISTSLGQLNLHLFHLLPRPLMPLLAFHIHSIHGFSILEHLIISLVIKIFFLHLLLHHLYS